MKAILPLHRSKHRSPPCTNLNGFADVFLVTPDKGLADTYVMAGYKWNLGESFGPLITKVWYHDFSTDEGSDDLGEEFDAVSRQTHPAQESPRGTELPL